MNVYEIGDTIEILYQETWYTATFLGYEANGDICFIYHSSGKEAVCSAQFVRKKV